MGVGRQFQSGEAMNQAQMTEAELWKARAEFLVEIVNAALVVADSVVMDFRGSKVAVADPVACAELRKLAARYADEVKP